MSPTGDSDIHPIPLHPNPLSCDLLFDNFVAYTLKELFPSLMIVKKNFSVGHNIIKKRDYFFGL